MKVMIVGDWAWSQYEAAFSAGLASNGIKVLEFKLPSYGHRMISRISSTLSLPTFKYFQIQKELSRAIRDQKPEVVLFWRPTRIAPLTLSRLKKLSFLVSYNNDDPFGPYVHKRAPWHHKWLWRRYISGLPHFHLNLFYRQVNKDEAAAFGSKRSEVLLPSFDPSRDRPLALTSAEEEQFSSDVTFIGHFEQDGRDSLLMSLVREGFKVKLFGSKDWSLSKCPGFAKAFPALKPLRGDAYAKAISAAKISLAFVSKLNRDTYTRRCFEIPAIGGLMLAERTADLLALFREDEEACFFDSKEELIQKVDWLLRNPEKRAEIARAGQRRVWADGHDMQTRAKQFIDLVKVAQMEEGRDWNAEA